MYNEALSIPLLRHQISGAAFPNIDLLVVAVDDGSTDNTLDLLKEWWRDDPRVVVVSYHPNRGLPGALTEGFKQAIERTAGQTEVTLITMDADGSHPIALLPSMTERIGDGYDIVLASRHQRGATQTGLSVPRRVLSWGASTLMRVFFPLHGVTDYSTNFRAYRVSLIERALRESRGHLVESTGFSGVVELLLRLCSLGPRVSEVPLTLRYDLKESPSKMKVWHTVRGYLGLILKKKARSSTGVCLPLPSGSVKEGLQS
jgi:dolichol-phosphate mannosyltransferase